MSTTVRYSKKEYDKHKWKVIGAHHQQGADIDIEWCEDCGAISDYGQIIMPNHDQTC